MMISFELSVLYYITYVLNLSLLKIVLKVLIGKLLWLLFFRIFRLLTSEEALANFVKNQVLNFLQFLIKNVNNVIKRNVFPEKLAQAEEEPVLKSFSNVLKNLQSNQYFFQEIQIFKRSLQTNQKEISKYCYSNTNVVFAKVILRSRINEGF